MTKRIIQKLVSASYSKDQLDSKIVQKIATILSRSDLKLYIRALKLAEKARTVSLVLPDAKIYNANRKLFEDLFPKKQIQVEEDPSLLLGVKVINNDMVYDMTLKDTLESFVNQI